MGLASNFKKMNLKSGQERKLTYSSSNIFATWKGYLFLLAVEVALFFIYYYILSPSNFSSFSDTLRYFISALGTLLAVVVSFNTLALQNQLKNMTTGMDSLNKQLDNLEDILSPVLHRRREDKKQDNFQVFKNSIIYFSDALESMIIVARDHARSIAAINSFKYSNRNGDDDYNKHELLCLTKRFINEAEQKLSLYKKDRTPYNLNSISTPYYIQKLKFNYLRDENEEVNQFYEIVKRLQALKGICQRIYIRDALAKISSELLASTIPIIIFIAAIASISNYEQYYTPLIRILFAVSLSTATLPFMLLLVRNIPILQLIRSSSTVPFTRNNPIS